MNSRETNFKARFQGLLSDRGLDLYVVDVKNNQLIDDFGVVTKNGLVDTSLPIKRKSIYRIRVSSFGMLTHAFRIEMSPGKAVDMGKVLAYLGETDGNNVIDKRDIDLIRRYRGVKTGSKRWDFGDNDADRAGEACDFNNDKVVDDKDYRIAYDNLGKRGSLK